MALTGEKGAIKLKGSSTSTIVKKMNKWEITVSVETVDTSTFDSNGWAENATSLKSWEITLEGILDTTDTTGQQALLNSLLNREPVDVELFVDKSSETADYTGKILVTEYSTGAALKDALAVSISGIGSGALTGAGVTAS